MVMTLFGRAALAGREGLGLQMVVGWGALCLLLTLWGVASQISLRWPAGLFVALALLGAAIKGRAHWRGDGAELGRLLVLALPLIWVMADVAPSQIDVFNLMLPNSAYLYDHAAFPRLEDAGALLGQPAAPPFNTAPFFSDLPVAPYSTEIVTLLGSLAGGGLAPNGLSLFTLVLHFAAALLFARVVTPPERRPGWLEAAFGLAMATVLNPGFVPRISFSGMGEAPCAITLLFSAWLAADVIEDLAAGQVWPRRLLPLALTLAALINIKQQAIGLFIAVVPAMALVAANHPRIGWRRGLRGFAAAALPALGLFLAWRLHVMVNFPAGELKPLAMSDWAWGDLAQICRQMVKVLLDKGYYLSSLLVVAALLAVRPVWLSPTARRVMAITAIVFVVFNLYLIAAYVVIFRGEHSYFRYCAELSLLVDLGIVLAARDALKAFAPGRFGTGLRAGGLALLAIMLVVPVAATTLLRFDRDMPQPRLRMLADRAAARLADGDRVALLVPGDDLTAAIGVGALLRFGRPNHLRLDITAIPANDAAAFDRAAADGYRLALVSCGNGAAVVLPGDSAALLELRDGQWRPLAVWPYPPPPRRSKWGWTEFIAHAPFCLE